MDHAIVLAYGTGFGGESLKDFGNLSVAKVPLLKRLIINCQRAGISRFTIVSEDKDKDSLLKIVDDKRVNSAIEWITPREILPQSENKVLVSQTNLLIHSSSIEDFITKSESLDKISSLSNSNENILNNGMFCATVDQINDLLKKTSVKEWLDQYSSSSQITYITPDEGYWATAKNSEDSIKDLENLIFSNVGKTATGWIARNINGRVSLPLSKQLIKTPLTPNMVSVLINVIGMLCGPFYALGYPVVGALFMQIATVLDRCDGEVARIKLMETKKGQWVDTLSDQVTVLSFIIGVSLGYYFESGKIIALILGGINLSIFIFFLIWSFYFLIKYTDSGSLVAYFQVDDVIDKENTTFVRKIIAFLRPMGRRNFYSMGFVFIAILGGYPWVLGVLSFALLLFLIHQVEDIIKISKL